MTAVEVIGVILAGSHVGGWLAVIAMVRMQRDERLAWAEERQKLVDRAIARHTGEIIALDRTEKGKPREPAPERLIEGLT